MLQQITPKEQRSSNTLHRRCLLKWHKTRNIKASDMKAYEQEPQRFYLKEKSNGTFPTKNYLLVCHEDGQSNENEQLLQDNKQKNIL